MGQTRESIDKGAAQEKCPIAPKQDPRVQRSRKLLVEAFRALIGEDSYADVSVAEIAQRARVNRGTFYAHFTDKEDLAKTMLREDLIEALSPHFSRKTPLNAEHLTRVGEVLFEFVGRLLLSCPTQVDAFLPVLTKTMQESIQTLVGDWIDFDRSALARFPSHDKEAITTVITWSLYGGALRWSARIDRPPARQAVQEIVTLLLR